MTVIEFFDNTPINNIVSTMANRPERVVFVGESSKMKRFAPVFQRFLTATGNGVTQAEYRTIRSHQLSEIVTVLDGIMRDYPGCHFDLTGGDDLSLTAAGMIYERCREQGVELHQYNINTGRVYDCDLDGNVASREVPPLTIAQNIVLHGGSIVSSEMRESGTYAWDWNEAFLQDIRAMWSVCRKRCGLWNLQISMVSDMLEFTRTDEDDLQLDVDIPSFKKHLANTGEKYNINLKGIFYSLERDGLILDFYSDGTTFQFRFKDRQVKRCLSKAGTILELYIYLMASELTDQDGDHYFTDGMTGVFIDWDGVVHDETEPAVDTENEIDVILMRGLVPVFISCKNGAVGEDELYKLRSVSDRFGGGHAKRVLVGTTFGRGKTSQKYLLERAKDMNIQVIEGVHEMSEEELKKRLKVMA